MWKDKFNTVSGFDLDYCKSCTVCNFIQGILAIVNLLVWVHQWSVQWKFQTGSLIDGRTWGQWLQVRTQKWSWLDYEQYIQQEWYEDGYTLVCWLYRGAFPFLPSCILQRWGFCRSWAQGKTAVCSPWRKGVDPGWDCCMFSMEKGKATGLLARCTQEKKADGKIRKPCALSPKI